MAKSKPITFKTNEQGCHLVTSHRIDRGGYAHIRRGKLMHRFIYEQHHGPIPEGLVVRHKCDNPSCINIEHLELGTHADNVRDKMERGRHAGGITKGEINGRAILTEDIVRKILRDTVSTNIALGKKYGVHHATISAIRKRKSWAHVVV